MSSSQLGCWQGATRARKLRCSMPYASKDITGDQGGWDTIDVISPSSLTRRAECTVHGDA
jgi:hypothetical protein